MTSLAILVLILISLICAWGAFSEAFQDNLFQRCGMIVALFGCIGMVGLIWKYHEVPHSTLTLLIGIFLFAAGTAVRVYNKRRKAAKHGFHH